MPIYKKSPASRCEAGRNLFCRYFSGIRNTKSSVGYIIPHMGISMVLVLSVFIAAFLFFS